MRREGWEHRLADLIADAQTRDFAYGTWDCALFACAAIAVATGTDPSTPFRGQYASEAECQAVLDAHGGVAGIADRIAAERGFAAIRVLQAQRGDIVLARIAERDTLGVCIGSRIAFAVAPRGLHTMPITATELLTAWRID